MKKILTVASAALLLAACSEKPGYTITGKVNNAELNGKYVYLYEYSFWLDNQMYCVVNTLGDTGAVVSYAVKPGQVLPSLPSKETETRKWYRVDTDTPYDITQPIYEDVTIYLKTLSAAAD